METPESIRAFLVPGEWVSPKDLSDAYLQYPHPPSFKEIPSVLPEILNLPVHISSLRASYSCTSVHNDSKRSEAYGSLQGNQISPVPGRLAYRGPVTGRVTTEYTDYGKPNSVLGVDHQSREVKPNQVFLFMGYKYHIDSSLVKPTQDSWLKLQDLILTIKSKPALPSRCLMSLIGSFASMEKMAPEGGLHMRPFSGESKRELEKASVAGHPPSLVRDHFSLPRVVAKSPQFAKGLKPSFQRPQFPNLYGLLKCRLERSFRTRLSKRSDWEKSFT